MAFSIARVDTNYVCAAVLVGTSRNSIGAFDRAHGQFRSPLSQTTACTKNQRISLVDPLMTGASTICKTDSSMKMVRCALPEQTLDSINGRVDGWETDRKSDNIYIYVHGDGVKAAEREAGVFRFSELLTRVLAEKTNGPMCTSDDTVMVAKSPPN
jgi:hypothetical protein